jgi:hypothetical protein
MNLACEIEVAQRGGTPLESNYDMEGNDFGERQSKINSSRGGARKKQ